MKTGTHISGAWVNVATFDKLVDAEKMRSFLEGRGFRALVEDERKLQRYWFISSSRAGIHVLVPETVLELVLPQLAAPSAAAILQKAVHCPSCDSTRVHYPAMTRKNILPTLVVQVLVAARLIKHEYYCENCHQTWMPAPVHRRKLSTTA